MNKAFEMDPITDYLNTSTEFNFLFNFSLDSSASTQFFGYACDIIFCQINHRSSMIFGKGFVMVIPSKFE